MGQQDVRERNRKKAVRHRAKLRAEGKCACGRELEDPHNHTVCEECRAKLRHQHVVRLARRIPGKICRCGKAIDREDRLQCADCRKAGNRLALAKYKGHLDAMLTAPVGGQLCRRCFKNLVMQERIECEGCWWKAKANSHFQDFGVVPLLQELWENQKRGCALTGLVIAPPNMELDHIVPLSRGGGKGVDNVQWVLPIANLMKMNLMQEEFIALCRAVAARHVDLDVGDEALSKGAAQRLRRKRSVQLVQEAKDRKLSISGLTEQS
jgi:hypothetical protein